jgi:hypothetical protein
MSKKVVGSLAVLAVALASGGVAVPALAQGHAAPAGHISTLPAAPELEWPLPPGVDARLATIDGKRMKGYVEEFARISYKSRDAGDKQWGRFAGLPSGDETQAWVTAKFKEIGLDVRVEPYTLPTQYIPRDWQVSVAAGDQAIDLSSAWPYIYFGDYMPAASGAIEADGVWVGLGTESDFLGKAVRGKVVFIYSVPTPSSMIQSGAWMGAVERAQKLGAKAIVVVIAIPGNMKNVSHYQGAQLDKALKLPIFALGLDDGERVEALNRQAKGRF